MARKELVIIKDAKPNMHNVGTTNSMPEIPRTLCAMRELLVCRE